MSYKVATNKTKNKYPTNEINKVFIGLKVYGTFFINNLIASIPAITQAGTIKKLRTNAYANPINIASLYIKINKDITKFIKPKTTENLYKKL